MDLTPPETSRRPSTVHLPPELAAFLANTTPQSLTVRGAPGVGKTTFALAVLAAFQGPRLMITTRVPADALRRQFTWLNAPSAPPVELLELVRYRGRPSMNIESVEYLRQTLQARASDLVDVSQVLNLPSELTGHLDSIMSNGPGLIAIDSWEAWVENILGSSAIRVDAPTTRWELERSMLDRLLATGASVLMVVEREERTRFDYITDGAVLLTASEADGREERWLEITKLRGVRIRSRSYPFTLEGARFRAILRPTSWTVDPARSEPDPDPHAPTLWPGSSEFAEHFGRIPSSGPLLIEADPETPARTLWKLVAPIMESALSGRGRVILSLPNTLGPRDLTSTLSMLDVQEPLDHVLRLIVPVGSALPEGDLARLCVPADRVASTGAEGSGTIPTELRGSGASVFEPAEFLRGRPTTIPRNLVVVFPSTTMDLAPEHRPDPLLLLPFRARQLGAEFSTVVVMRADDPFLNEGRVRAPVHIIVRTRRGQILLCGVRPWTPSLVLRPGSGDGPPRVPYELIPIV